MIVLAAAIVVFGFAVVLAVHTWVAARIERREVERFIHWREDEVERLHERESRLDDLRALLVAHHNDREVEWGNERRSLLDRIQDPQHVAMRLRPAPERGEAPVSDASVDVQFMEKGLGAIEWDLDLAPGPHDGPMTEVVAGVPDDLPPGGE